MSKTAIRFENVSKQFTLHRDRPRSFQDLFLFWRRYRRQKPEKLWVLRDISFEVGSGETLGLIGPNGVGKSTILKLIAGIISPTSGQIQVSGRVSSLLELGAGFHPDLTGRENVFLYGSLLGLSRAAMQKRFDDIVQFSELEEFIDAAVKTYSSGMYLRLAFSVAIHVEPEVLLIDEILAVGDEAFRAKCLGRITALQDEGVTILFVSHALSTVQRLCSRALWMSDGRLRAEGPADLVARRYLDAVAQKQSQQLAEHNLKMLQLGDRGQSPQQGSSSRWGSAEVEITQVRVLDGAGQERYTFVTGEELTIQMHYRAAAPVEKPTFGLALHRSDGLHVTGPNTEFGNLEIPVIEGGGIVEYTIPWLPLLSGRYQISVMAQSATDSRVFDYHGRMYTFLVNPGGTKEQYGLVGMRGQWRQASGQ